MTVKVRVFMTVTATGGPFTDQTGGIDTTIDVTESRTTFKFRIPTTDDSDDEDSGPITVELLPRAGYALAQGQTTASVKVYDNDGPARLRANGHRAVQGLGPDRGIKLRWDQSEAIQYDVQFYQLRCIRDGACVWDQDTGGDPITMPNVTTWPSVHAGDTQQRRSSSG